MANRTAESPELLEALKARAGQGDCEFTLVIPSTPHGLAWAADMSNGGSPTPQMDRLARALAQEFRIPWSGSGAVSSTTGRYRFQLIYRSNVGGNHFNHVHFGVKRI